MSKVDIIPAIDIKNGKCVRLLQGRPDDVTVYSENPVEMARKWELQGALRLHVVDLDGAFSGAGVHGGIISEICNAIRIPVQIGGGLRSEEDIQRALDSGVDTAIIGTKAAVDPESVISMARRFGKSLGIGIDARNGEVMVKGWSEGTGISAVEIARKMDSIGVGRIIYTDIARDGMLTGVNLDAVKEVCLAVKCDVVASGGVGSMKDIEGLEGLQCANLAGVIVGKALYEGKFSLMGGASDVDGC